MMKTTDDQAMRALVTAHFEQSIATAQSFFASEAEKVTAACWAMARRFHQGGRLLAFGNGAWATDALHIAVEFVHPVIVGKRALPALALTSDSASISSSMARGEPTNFARQLAILARPQDIALGFSPDGNCANVVEALTMACGRGLLTLGLTGNDGGVLGRSELDYCFVVPSGAPPVIQETHETLYHILWELVHVFFEHEGMLK